jgi:hypothetical protein
MSNADALADRYVALWNEPDADRRRSAIAELWTANGAHILQPPQEMREIAARPGIGLTATLEARGHSALEARATTAYEEFISAGEFRFQRRDDVERLADVVSSPGRWSPGTGTWRAPGWSSSSSPPTAASNATTSSSRAETAFANDLRSRRRSTTIIRILPI